MKSTDAESRELERENRRKLRANVVRCEAWNPTKQRQGSETIGCARAVKPLLVTEGHKRIEFVLHIAGEEIASRAAWTKAPRIAGCGLVKAVIEISSPPGISPFGICVEDA